MNGLPYYKAYPRDFIEGTIGMPFEVKGAYRLVLDLIYMQGGSLPDDARYISGLLGCTIRKWKALRDELISMGKLEINGEFLSNKRAVLELKTLSKLQETQRENRSKPNKNNAFCKPRSNHTEPEPDTKVKEEPNGSSKNARGTRLPNDWIADIGFALTLGLSQAQAENEATKFREWWPAQPGQKGVKIDWNLTWKTWCRSAAERSQRSQAKPRKSAFQERHENAREQINRALGITDDDKHSDFDNGNIIDLGRANYRG